MLILHTTTDHPGQFKRLTRQHGFTLFEVVLSLVLLGMLGVFYAQTSGYFFTFSQATNTMMTRERLNIVRNAIMQAAQDVDSDQYYEVYTPDIGSAVPASLNLGSIAKDEWGKAFLYCAGPPNGSDATYAQNSGVYVASGQKAMIVSAGKDGAFQTTCANTVAQGDDIAVYLTESDIRYAKGGIGGFKHAMGEISPITANDNVNLSGSLVTPLNATALPLVDPQSNTIRPGTLGYQTTTTAARGPGMYIHDGLGQADTNWKGFGGGYCYTRVVVGWDSSVLPPTCSSGFVTYKTTSGLKGCWASGGGTPCLYYAASVCCTSSNPVEYDVVTECSPGMGSNPGCSYAACESGFNSILQYQEDLGTMGSDCWNHPAHYRMHNICSTQVAPSGGAFNLGGGSSHTSSDCVSAGGTVVYYPTLGSYVCRVGGGSCPGGWNDTGWKYYNAQSKPYVYGCSDCSTPAGWSTTIPSCYYGCGCCGDNCTPMCSYSYWYATPSYSMCN